MISLFRKESLDYQGAKLLGDVVFASPPKYSIVTIVFAAIIILSLVFVTTQSYSRKEKVVGYLEPEEGLSRLFVERTAFVKEISVAVGDFVTQGDILAELASGSNLMDGGAVSGRLVYSLEQELKEVDNRIESVFQRIEFVKSDYKKLIERKSLEVEKLIDEKSDLDKAMLIAERQQKRLEKLERSGLAASIDRENLEINYLRYSREIKEINRLIELRASEVDSLQSSKSMEEMTLREEISSLKQRKEQIQQQVYTVKNQSNFSIKAPVSGVVTSVFESNGSQVDPGRSLMTIQKENSSLIGKLVVPSRSVGLIKEGQEVLISYDAFPYQRFGVYKGSVKKIYRNIVRPMEYSGPLIIAEAFYYVDVELPKQSISAFGESVSLLSGMTLQADIVVEKNTLVDWILSPIKALKK